MYDRVNPRRLRRLAVLLLLIVLPRELPAQQDVSIEVSAMTVASSSGSTRLEFELTNTGANPITMYRDYLPWRLPQNIALAVFTSGPPYVSLPRSLPMANSGPARITIFPNESIKGWTLLEDQFPGFENWVQRFDVEVAWSYQLRTVWQQMSNRTSGWIVVPMRP